MCSCILAGLSCHSRRFWDHASATDLPVGPCNSLTPQFPYQWVVLPVLKGKEICVQKLLRSMSEEDSLLVLEDSEYQSCLDNQGSF